jgi:hypothetical protein
MSGSKTHTHISVYVARAMLEELDRLSEEEFMPRSSWHLRALMNEIQRLRKLRGEAPFKLDKRAPNKRGAHLRKTRLITE